MIATAIIHDAPEFEFSALVTASRGWLKHVSTSWYICALAPGWDTAMAHAAILENIPITACMPFIRPVSQWDSLARDRHNQVIARARQSFVLSHDVETPERLKACDDWRTNSANVIFINAHPTIRGAQSGGKNYINLGQR